MASASRNEPGPLSLVFVTTMMLAGDATATTAAMKAATITKKENAVRHRIGVNACLGFVMVESLLSVGFFMIFVSLSLVITGMERRDSQKFSFEGSPNGEPSESRHQFHEFTRTKPTVWAQLL
jgi:hypothetical protein